MRAAGGDLASLHAQRDARAERAAAETVLTKRQLRVLGLQAAARVAEAAASPLAILAELAQNLPSYAPLLSSVRVPRNLTCAGLWVFGRGRVGGCGRGRVGGLLAWVGRGAAGMGGCGAALTPLRAPSRCAPPASHLLPPICAGGRWRVCSACCPHPPACWR